MLVLHRHTRTDMLAGAHLRYICVFVGGILLGVAAMLAMRELQRRRLAGSDRTKQNIVKLVRQAARWSTAARQDRNAMIAVLHANYGAGYLWALQDIAKAEQIEAAAGIDITKFQKEIVATQDAATKAMAALCPKYAPKKTYLTLLGGEG